MGCGSSCGCSSGGTAVLDGPLPVPFAEPCCGSCAMGWPCEAGCGSKADGSEPWSLPKPVSNPGFQFLPGDSWSVPDPGALSSAPGSSGTARAGNRA